MSRSSKRAAVAVAGLAMLVAAGVAFGAIPDPGGVIHGCYDKKGALRVLDPTTDACGKGESALDWSQQGPPGPAGTAGAQGPQGPAGLQGPQGPAGSSHGYAFKVTGVGIDTTPTSIISGSVPAGTYMVWAQTWFDELVVPTAADTLVSCSIDSPFSQSATEVVLHKEPSNKVIVNAVGEATLVGSLTLTAETNTVGLTCSATDDQVDARETNLDLIPVGALN